jgi:hypothetical protein
MKRITRFLCRCVRHTDRRTLVSIGLCVGYLLLVAVVLVLLNVCTGCATTPAGLSREQVLHQAGGVASSDERVRSWAGMGVDRLPQAVSR